MADAGVVVGAGTHPGGRLAGALAACLLASHRRAGLATLERSPRAAVCPRPGLAIARDLGRRLPLVDLGLGLVPLGDSGDGQPWPLGDHLDLVAAPLRPAVGLDLTVVAVAVERQPSAGVVRLATVAAHCHRPAGSHAVVPTARPPAADGGRRGPRAIGVHPDLDRTGLDDTGRDADRRIDGRCLANFSAGLGLPPPDKPTGRSHLASLVSPNQPLFAARLP